MSGRTPRPARAARRLARAFTIEGDPLTAWWKGIVDSAAATLAVGGGDVDRCEELLRRGRERGIEPCAERVRILVAVFAERRRRGGGA